MQPLRHLGLSCVGSLAILLTSCSTTPSQKKIADAPVFERGFQIFPSPRTFDGPGTIFRVDVDGVRHAVVDLSPLLSIVSREEAVPTLRVQGLINIAALYSWMSGVHRGIQLQRGDSATVSVTGAHREQAYEADLKRVVDSARLVIDWSKGGKVYLITETISADSVDIHLSTSLALAIGDSLRTDSASIHGISVSWRPRSSADLSLRFPKPYRVFYKVEQLARREPLEQDSLSRLTRIPIGQSLFWKEVP